MNELPLPRLGIPRSGITHTGDTADGYRVVSTRRLAHSHRPLSVLELALVTAVVGIAVAVAVPEYLHLRREAGDDSVKSRLAQAAQALERHRASAGTFAGVTVPAGVRVHAAAGNSFCVDTGSAKHAWHERGPNGKPTPGTCAVLARLAPIRH